MVVQVVYISSSDSATISPQNGIALVSRMYIEFHEQVKSLLNFVEQSI